MDELILQRARVAPYAWEARALCKIRGWPTSEFFGEQGSRRDKGMDARQRRVKRLCAQCPVRRECLTEAVSFERTEHGYRTAGIWAGLTEGERHRREVNHEEGCAISRRQDACRGCRPVEEILNMLDDFFQAQAARQRVWILKEAG